MQSNAKQDSAVKALGKCSLPTSLFSSSSPSWPPICSGILFTGGTCSQLSALTTKCCIFEVRSNNFTLAFIKNFQAMQINQSQSKKMGVPHLSDAGAKRLVVEARLPSTGASPATDSPAMVLRLSQDKAKLQVQHWEPAVLELGSVAEVRSGTQSSDARWSGGKGE